MHAPRESEEVNIYILSTQHPVIILRYCSGRTGRTRERNACLVWSSKVPELLHIVYLGPVYGLHQVSKCSMSRRGPTRKYNPTTDYRNIT